MKDKHLLLLGGGHAQLAVLLALARERPPGWRVTLLTPQPAAIYSGMLPGWMAGHYRLDQCAIALGPLVQAAGAELRLGEAVAIDAGRQTVTLADGGMLDYTLLSLDIGSAVAVGALGAPAVRTARGVLPVRPIASFTAAWPRIAEAARRRRDYRVAVLGAGAGGVELAFAARAALGCPVSLVAGQGGVLTGHAPAVRRGVQRWLDRRGIETLAGPALPRDGELRLADGRVLHADALLAATGSQPVAWLAATGLALAADGRVLVDARQRSVSHAGVHAAGDVCQQTDGRLSPSGVHAVRAGPVLAHNLLAAMRGGSPVSWRPRRHSLYLLSTGPQHAVMSWGPFSAAGGWVWRWKDRIDRGFIATHTTGGEGTA